MLTIRREQLRAFEEAAADAYVGRVLPALKATFPDECAVHGARLRALLREGVDRAEARGISTEENVYCWLQIAVTLGVAFDDEPWARVVFEEDLSQEDAVDVLCAIANERLGRT